MSCATPIAGYDNEALVGVVATAGVGWPTPLDDPAALAARIAALDRDRPALADAALRARQFATEHAFEPTMAARVDHMLACCEVAAPAGVAT
jgi:glycosyltransferase involved in cell wall biosynthesis